jgi:hypothetical protein
MTRRIVIPIILLLLIAGASYSQEVVITGFPVGVAGSVEEDFFQPYYPELQAVADTLNKYPSARAIITGGADGYRYRQNSDAKNPGVALGRAHTLRLLLIHEFGVDSSKINIQTKEVRVRGEQYRFASVRISWELSALEARIDSVANRPPIERHFTEVKEVADDPVETFGLQFGAGVSTSPFGGIPIVTGAITWQRTIFVEAVLGHTFWNSEFGFEGVDLDTWKRMAGAQVIVYPWEEVPLGFVGGWMRIEDVSRDYHKYVRLSEGPMVGLRVTPLEFLSVTGVYNPSKHREVGELLADSKNGRFLLSVTAHLTFGGEK